MRRYGGVIIGPIVATLWFVGVILLVRLVTGG